MVSDKIRVSFGSAAVLELLENKKVLDPPSTCYIMTYKKGLCSANCGFCPQSRSSQTSQDKLSRISWPIFNFKDFLMKLTYQKPSRRFKRLCVQTLNYQKNFEDLIQIVRNIKENVSIPISAAIPPMSKEKLKELKINGIQRIGIALDAATPETFKAIKGSGVNGPYTWEDHFNALEIASEIFTKGNVSTHIIHGLGDTQEEITNLILKLREMDITPSLFAFTPIKGTRFENKIKPDINEYRKLQLARYLIIEENCPIDMFTFNNKGKIININIDRGYLSRIIDNQEAFKTAGCPNCDRPYYTSRPSGPIYNFPRDLKKTEKEDIFHQLKQYIKF